MKKVVDKSLSEDGSELNHKAYGIGAKLFSEGSFKSAKNEFKLALEYWPEDPESWLALGNCFDELNKPKKAEECFRKALMFCSEKKEPDIYFNLGNSLFDQSRYNEAIECYQKVTTQSTTYAVAQINLKKAKDRLS